MVLQCRIELLGWLFDRNWVFNGVKKVEKNVDFFGPRMDYLGQKNAFLSGIVRFRVTLIKITNF